MADAQPGQNLGPNEWLVDEMYQRYQQDPNSVDKAWWDFFKNYSAQDLASETKAGNGAVTAPAAPAPAAAAPPAKAPAAPAKPASSPAPAAQQENPVS